MRFYLQIAIRFLFEAKSRNDHRTWPHGRNLSNGFRVITSRATVRAYEIDAYENRKTIYDVGPTS